MNIFLKCLLKITQLKVLFSSLIVAGLEIKTVRWGLDFMNAVFLLDTGKGTKCVFPEHRGCDKRKQSP